jgi:hypothetical protein
MALIRIVTVVGVMIALAVGFAGTRTVGPAPAHALVAT